MSRSGRSRTMGPLNVGLEFRVLTAGVCDVWRATARYSHDPLGRSARHRNSPRRGLAKRRKERIVPYQDERRSAKSLRYAASIRRLISRLLYLVVVFLADLRGSLCR